MIKMFGIGRIFNLNTSNEVHALTDVNMEIRRGDFVAITGPSGSGKSTLLHILAGLDNASSGKYLFQGRDMSTLSDREKCKLRNMNIAVILQSYGLIGSETVLRNICLPHIIGGTYKTSTKKSAMEMLKKVGLGDVINKQVNQLSGGQRQRVAIARALLMNADVILADEPTGALDTKNTKALMDLLEELNSSGVTIIIVTHNVAVAERCPTAYTIVDGRINRIR